VVGKEKTTRNLCSALPGPEWDMCLRRQTARPGEVVDVPDLREPQPAGTSRIFTMCRRMSGVKRREVEPEDETVFSISFCQSASAVCVCENKIDARAASPFLNVHEFVDM
jgi:hypothetical protein